MCLVIFEILVYFVFIWLGWCDVVKGCLGSGDESGGN